MSLLKEKYVFIKNIGWLIKFRCNSVSINEALLELVSIYVIVVVQSWKSTTLKIMNGIKDVFLILFILKVGSPDYGEVVGWFVGINICHSDST